MQSLPMPPLQFVPKREFWFVSAFVNSAAVDPPAWGVDNRLSFLFPERKALKSRRR